jgi:LacI family transcriptional regulator
VSLRAIAKRLDLSVTTVSRALGGFPEVAVSTRARVMAESERIGYRPNQLARRLRHGRSEAVGLVLPADAGQFDDPFFLRLLAAVGPPLQRAGLDLLVMTARPGAEELRAYRHLIEARGPPRRRHAAGPHQARRSAHPLPVGSWRRLRRARKMRRPAPLRVR